MERAPRAAAVGTFIRFPPPRAWNVPPIFLRLCAAPLDEMEANATASPKDDLLLATRFCNCADRILTSVRICEILLFPDGDILASFRSRCCLLEVGRTFTNLGRILFSYAKKDWMVR